MLPGPWRHRFDICTTPSLVQGMLPFALPTDSPLRSDTPRTDLPCGTFYPRLLFRHFLFTCSVARQSALDSSLLASVDNSLAFSGCRSAT